MPTFWHNSNFVALTKEEPRYVDSDCYNGPFMLTYTLPHCLHFPSCLRLWTQWCLIKVFWKIIYIYLRMTLITAMVHLKECKPYKFGLYKFSNISHIMPFQKKYSELFPDNRLGTNHTPSSNTFCLHTIG